MTENLLLLLLQPRLGAFTGTSYLKQKQAEDGDVLPLPGSPVVIGMPGHPPRQHRRAGPDLRSDFRRDALTTRHVLTGLAGVQLAPSTHDTIKQPIRSIASPPSWSHGFFPAMARRFTVLQRKPSPKPGHPADSGSTGPVS